MNEAQTRKDLIDPAIESAGWTKANGCQVLVEQSACEFAPGRVGKVRGKALRADYILTHRGRRLVVVEAKSDEHQAIEGYEQALKYAVDCKEGDPTIVDYTEAAIGYLERESGKEGFFLMVEGAHIDKHSHSNEDANMTEALEAFDKTVEFALEYAKADGETLVIVTADHETGAITPENGGYVFTSGSHSAANVPVRVYGADKLIYKGEVLNNYEIPIRIAYTLGFTEDEFPFEVVA